GVEPLPGDGPVNQVEVDVIEAEPLQAAVERTQRAVVSLIGVPQLRRDEQRLAGDAAFADRGADVRLVAVDARGVDVRVPAVEGGGDGRPGGRARRRLPHAETD